MKKLFSMAAPILPGKTEQWRAFANSLRTEQSQAFKQSREKLGVRERSFLQKTPTGDLVIVTLEGENPSDAFAQFGQGNDQFTKWFVSQVKEIHGIDLTAPAVKSITELVLDSHESKVSTM